MSGGLNFGLRMSRGRYVAILDDDDYWLGSDKLARQTARLEAEPGLVGCGGGLVVIDPDGREVMRYLKPVEHDAMRTTSLISNPIAHSTVLYRREVACAIGGYDESYSTYSDWDFCLRLGERGKLYNFPEYLACYRMWPQNSSSSNQRRNAACTVAIVWQHRMSYPGVSLALAYGAAYYCYALLPRFVRARIFLPISRIKKRLFSEKNRSP